MFRFYNFGDMQCIKTMYCLTVFLKQVGQFEGEIMFMEYLISKEAKKKAKYISKIYFQA